MMQNRIELVGMFTAMRELVRAGNFEGLEKVLDAVLEEAQFSKSFEYPYNNFAQFAAFQSSQNEIQATQNKEEANA